MSWSRTPPSVPGRYWWKAPDKYKRDDRRQYGLILVQWTKYGDMEPQLRIVTMCSFNSAYGGELDDRQGWSYGGSYAPTEFDKHYPGVEFWSEPERGPEGFLPELPGRPNWTPPDPEVVEAKRKETAEKAAKRRQEETDERAEKIAEAKASGDVLYECEQCEELYTEDELVQVRECPHCNDEKFNGTEEGQNCPSCNRRFTRNITEKGCPECLDDECPVLAESEPTPEPHSPAPPEPKKKRTRKL